MDLEFNKNEDQLKILVSEVKTKLKKIHQGGGEKKLAKQHAQGKLSARERIKFLLDQGYDVEVIDYCPMSGYIKERKTRIKTII